MKTQAISNQPNFKGKFYFVDIKQKDNLISEKINKYIPQLEENVIEHLNKILSPKPYDLFISNSKDVNGFYEINANVNHKNIFSKDRTHAAKPTLVMQNKPERIEQAAYESMEKYEKTPNYKQDIKPENIFVSIYKSLF